MPLTFRSAVQGLGVLTLVLFGLCPIARSQATAPASTAPTMPPDLAAALPGFVPEPGRAYVTIVVVPPINLRELEVWKGLLELSEMQAGALAALHATYYERDQSVRKGHLPNILELSRAFGGQGANASTDIGVAEGYAHVAAACHELMTELAKVESGLLTALSDFLADPQRARLERVEYRRQRARQSALSSFWPASSADLSALAISMNLHDCVDPVRRDAISMLVLQYERSASRLAEQYIKASFRSLEEATVLMAMANAAATDEERHRITKDRRRIQRAAASCERKLVRLNRTYLDLITDLVTEEQASALLLAFGARAYPEVWPNPHDLGKIFQHALSLDLPPDVRTWIDAAYATHQSNQRDACFRMMDVVDDWMDDVIEQNAQPPGPFEEFKNEMTDLNGLRALDAERQIAAIVGILSIEQREGLQPLIDVYGAAIKRRMPREIGLSFRP